MPSFTVYKGRADGGISKATTTKPDLFGDQVYLEVTASGLCGTDLHYRRNDIALGHEGVGIVQALGPAAVHLKIGDRVGWGYVHTTCNHCDQCLAGHDVYCPYATQYAIDDLDQGSMASHAVWSESHLFKIPDGLSDEAAAPLQCGGATVYSALRSYGVKPTDVVGVVGVGGLGHLAIQFAAKMGCEVVVLSSTDSKKAEAMRLGAKHFIATKGKQKLELERPLNRLLVSTSVPPDWDLLLPILAPEASIYPLTVSMDPMSIPSLALIIKGLTIQGTATASRGVHREMLAFAASHHIAPIVEKYPLSEEGILKAMERLEKGEMRYRGVLIPESQMGSNGI